MPEETKSNVYPITTKLEVELKSNNLLGTLGQYALDYVGEYEHGSVDLSSLFTGGLKEWYETGSDGNGLSEEEKKWWDNNLLELISNAIGDFVLSESVQEGEEIVEHAPGVFEIK